MAGGRRVVGILSLALLVGSCGRGGEEGVSVEACLVTASIGFQGREYTAANHIDGLGAGHVEVGKRLGIGEAPQCGSEALPITVFAVVGVPVVRAVYVKPLHGLMVRSHYDEDPEASHVGQDSNP